MTDSTTVKVPTLIKFRLPLAKIESTVDRPLNTQDYLLAAMDQIKQFDLEAIDEDITTGAHVLEFLDNPNAKYELIETDSGEIGFEERIAQYKLHVQFHIMFCIHLKLAIRILYGTVCNTKTFEEGKANLNTLLERELSELPSIHSFEKIVQMVGLTSAGDLH